MHTIGILLFKIQVHDLLLVYGLENLAETLIEGLSRVKRCTDEGRALMQLDLQVFLLYYGGGNIYKQPHSKEDSPL